MENRKSLKFLIPILLLGFFVFNAPSVFAYSVETHGYLTKSIVDFYNKHYPNNKISEELAAFLIDGARLEDNVPRYFNHFYDPVNQIGLADKIYRGMASKLWAQDQKEQLALMYRILPQTEIPTLLTASQIQIIKPEFNQSDFTWQNAIDLYAKGEKEKALFALGHTLHLIEDASVPDHTRNDSHPPFDDGGSPYENWTERFNLKNFDFDLTNRLKNKKPISLGSLNEYFDGIANYSNNNFYSKDSIKNYSLPSPDYFKKIGRYFYAFKKDQENGDYKLAVTFGDPTEFSWAKEINLYLKEKQGDLVIKDYWNQLSVKAVQYGAGVIDLFFKEAEAARAKYLTEKSQRPYLATLVDGVNSIFGGGESSDPSDLIDEFKLVEEIPITNKPNPTNTTDENKKKNKPAAIETEIVSLQLASVEQIVTPIITTSDASEVQNEQPKEEPKFCSFATSQSPTRQGVIINEVAWMGTANSANDEWLELKNISGGEIDLSDWQVLDMGEQIKIELTGKLAPNSFYLLERTNDDSVPGIAADQTYVGALSNVGEGLRLFDKNCGLIDEALASPDWPAGDNNLKLTMERMSDLSWRHYSGDGQNGINGTPKAENSQGTVPVSNIGSHASSAPTNTQTTTEPEQPSQNQETQNQEPEQPAPTPSLKILISEIQAGTEANGAEDEFVELYNPNDQAVDLAGWALKKKTSTGTESNLVSSGSFAGTIAPKSFFLISHANYQGAKPKDLTYSANSNNLAYTSNSVVLYDANGNAIDEASWTDIPKGQSLERKALVDDACTTATDSGEYLGNGCDTDSTNDFELREIPNPQNIESLPEPRSAPAAVTNFQISYSSESLELFFTWDSVEGADQYDLVDVTTTAEISATKSIEQTGLEYIFTIYAVDKDDLYSEGTQASIYAEDPPQIEDGQLDGGDDRGIIQEGISNVLFSSDEGGNFISFTLNDTFHDLDNLTIHYILVWLNGDPKEMTVPNRGSGIGPNWAGYCPSIGIVSGNGGDEGTGGTGFDNYVMPGYEPAAKPPIYDPNNPSYDYKVYFTETCPNSGMSGETDLTGELTEDNFVTFGLWYYYTNMGVIDDAKSINYPDRIYFVPKILQ